MNVLQAAFNVIHDAEGGAQALGRALGKRDGVLSHEVNPNRHDAKLGLADAVKISVLTGDRRIANAFASEVGCMLVPLPAAGVGCDGAAAKTAALAKEFGELMAELSVDLADGQVSDNERSRIEREGGELVAALQQLLAEVRDMNAQPRLQAVRTA